MLRLCRTDTEGVARGDAGRSAADASEEVVCSGVLTVPVAFN